MIATHPDIGDIWEWLGAVADPEIPVISVVDLGIVRDVAWVEHSDSPRLRVTISPTYSGCPATRVIERDIKRALTERGIDRVEINVQLAPPWTTEWISDAGRVNLRDYGISPPAHGAIGSLDITSVIEPRVACPRCESGDVEMLSRFGSTPCKALYRCNACREPFDHFKCH